MVRSFASQRTPHSGLRAASGMVGEPPFLPRGCSGSEGVWEGDVGLPLEDTSVFWLVGSLPTVLVSSKQIAKGKGQGAFRVGSVCLGRVVRTVKVDQVGVGAWQVDLGPGACCESVHTHTCAYVCVCARARVPGPRNISAIASVLAVSLCTTPVRHPLPPNWTTTCTSCVVVT